MQIITEKEFHEELMKLIKKFDAMDLLIESETNNTGIPGMKKENYKITFTKYKAKLNQY